MDRQALIDLAYKAEQKYGLPKGLLVAQLHQESSDGTNTANSEGPVGVMQIQPGTAKALGFDPNDPAQAIDGAGKIMAHNIAQSGGDAGHALKLYYAGSEKGIGPRSNAYPGQVTSKWATPDLVDDVTDFSNHPAPSASPAPATPNAAPAASESDDFDFSGGQPTATPASAPPAPPSETAASADQLANMQRLNAEAIAAGKVPPFEKLLDRTTGHTVAGDSQAGFVQGAKNTFATLNNLAVGADKAVPALNMLDQAASSVIPGVSPNKLAQASAANLADRNRFNAGYGSQYSDFGQMTGEGVSQAPFMMAGGGLVGAGARAVGGEGVNPLLQFMSGQGGNGILGRAGSLATAGATAGGFGGAMSSAGSDASLGSQIGQGMAAGAVAGPLLGALTGGYAGTGARINPITARTVGGLADLGVNVRGSQISPIPAVRTLDSVLARVPGSGIAADNALQSAQWNQALRGTFGAQDLTPEGMSAAKAKLSGNYEKVGNETNLDLNPETGSSFLDSLAAAARQAKTKTVAANHPLIDGMVDDVLGAIDNGQMTGQQALALTRKGGPLDFSGSTDGFVKGAGKQIKGLINGELGAQASPENAALLDKTNKSWGAMKTVERAVANSADGEIRPATLQNMLTSNYGKDTRAYTNLGDIDTLANGGKLIADQGSSNTAERGQTFKFLTGAAKTMGTAGATLLGIQHGISPEEISAALGATAGTLAASHMAGRILRGSGYRNRLVAASLNDNPATPINYLPQALGVIGYNALTAITAPQRGR